MKRLIVALATVLSLAACGNPSATKAPEAPASAPVAEEAVPLPPPEKFTMPAWASSLVGTQFAASYPKIVDTCTGNAEAVIQRFGDVADGVVVGGWAWDTKSSTSFPKIVAVDESGKIVGAGETVRDRSDVRQSSPDVTGLKSGFDLYVNLKRGKVHVYGASDAGEACLIQHWEVCAGEVSNFCNYKVISVG